MNNQEIRKQFEKEYTEETGYAASGLYDNYNLAYIYWLEKQYINNQEIKQVCEALISNHLSNSPKGIYCIYCKETAYSTIKHKLNCPVVKAKKLLREIEG